MLPLIMLSGATVLNAVEKRNSLLREMDDVITHDVGRLGSVRDTDPAYTKLRDAAPDFFNNIKTVKSVFSTNRVYVNKQVMGWDLMWQWFKINMHTATWPHHHAADCDHCTESLGGYVCRDITVELLTQCNELLLQILYYKSRDLTRLSPFFTIAGTIFWCKFLWMQILFLILHMHAMAGITYLAVIHADPEMYAVREER
jgi:hypothetical protein